MFVTLITFLMKMLANERKFKNYRDYFEGNNFHKFKSSAFHTNKFDFAAVDARLTK